MKPLREDNPIEEIPEIRRRLAARYSYSPRKQLAAIQRRQKDAADRMFHRESEVPPRP
jgi:hypothetical protein